MSLDLETVTRDFLQQCGLHDYGVTTACACPDGDFRPVMHALVVEVGQLRADNSAALATLTELAPLKDRADLVAECSKLADQVERLKADRRALDIAVTGLRELETTWANDAKSAGEWSDPAGHAVAEVISECREAVSALLQKIGGTR